jgi:hypothetical protein
MQLSRDLARVGLAACGTLILAASCGSPTVPTQFAAIRDARYQHAVSFNLQPDTRVELEFWDCSRGTGRDGPSVCLLTSNDGATFRCPDPTFMMKVSTACDSQIDVLLRTATRNPQLQVAHDIYLNGTRVSRLMPISPLDYERESAVFRIDSQGRIR